MGPPPPPAPARRSRLVLGIVVGGMALVLALSVGVAITIYRVNASIEVTTEPVASSVNPFAPNGSIGIDATNVQAASQAGGTFSATTTGLYGGTLNKVTCDAQKLVSFLQGAPDKAKAWADAQGVAVDAIGTFVAGLTPVVLRADTVVVNHGWKDGKANPFSAVLQAGTGVLIDRFGTPVVKCYCGNPLKAHTSTKNRRYSGTTWPGWSTDQVVKVEPAPNPQASFTLVDVDTGKPFTRAVGNTPTDTPLEPQPSATPSTSPSASATKPTTSTADQASTLLRRRIDECAARGTRYPWPPHKKLAYRADPKPDGDTWTVNVDATKPDDTVELFVWQVNPVENWVRPADNRAEDAARYCSLLAN